MASLQRERKQVKVFGGGHAFVGAEKAKSQPNHTELLF